MGWKTERSTTFQIILEGSETIAVIYLEDDIMKICTVNKNDITDKVYIHDSFITQFIYSYEDRRIIVKLSNLYLKKNFTLTFDYVIYSEIQNCNFWGNGNLVLGLDLFIHTPKLKMLINSKDNKKYKSFELMENNQYIETAFILNSGNTITIICKEINFEEDKI